MFRHDTAWGQEVDSLQQMMDEIESRLLPAAFADVLLVYIAHAVPIHSWKQEVETRLGETFLDSAIEFAAMADEHGEYSGVRNGDVCGIHNGKLTPELVSGISSVRSLIGDDEVQRRRARYEELRLKAESRREMALKEMGLQ